MAAAAATMAMRAVLVAVVLMQCCNMIVTARPLLETPAVAGGAAGAGTSWGAHHVGATGRQQPGLHGSQRIVPLIS